MTSFEAYNPVGRLTQNDWITPASTPDPDNLPVPLGWVLLIRPYPVIQNEEKSKIILDKSLDIASVQTNIGRVVAMGPCCFSRADQRDIDGNQFNWVEVGDFISYPKNVGSRRKFKGVSYVLLMDDEVVEKLPDPQVFDDSFIKLDIPEDHMVKYNTIKNPNYKKGMHE